LACAAAKQNAETPLKGDFVADCMVRTSRLSSWTGAGACIGAWQGFNHNRDNKATALYSRNQFNDAFMSY
jgi:hypothetical protein